MRGTEEDGRNSGCDEVETRGSQKIELEGDALAHLNTSKVTQRRVSLVSADATVLRSCRCLDICHDDCLAWSFSSLAGSFVRLVQRGLSVRGVSNLKVCKSFNRWADLSSLVLRLEFSNCSCLGIWFFSESLNQGVCSFGLAFDGTPNLILHFAFCFGSFSASDACDGFPSQNSSHGEASSIAVCLICAITRSSSCPGVLVSLSTDPEQKPSICHIAGRLLYRISRLRPCLCRLRKINAGAPNNKSCGRS